MDRVRQVCLGGAVAAQGERAAGAAAAGRAHRGRAPDAESLAPFADILRDEVNVKEVVADHDVAAHGRFEIAVNARACGPRLGGGHPEGDPRGQGGGVDRDADGTVVAAGIELLPGEYRAAGSRRPTPDATAALPGTPGWSCWTPRSRRSWPPRAWRATWCAWCSRPAGTPGWTCPTGSR